MIHRITILFLSLCAIAFAQPSLTNNNLDNLTPTAKDNLEALGVLTDDAGPDNAAVASAIAEDPAATKSALSPFVSTVALYGDSLSGGVIEAGATTLTSASVLDMAMSRIGHVLTPLRYGTTETNFNQGGMGADWLYTNILPDLITADPDVAIVHAGVNNLATSRTTHGTDLDAAAEEIVGYLEDTWDALVAAGIKVIAQTLTPDNSPTDVSFPPASGYYHPDYRTIRLKVNELIRERAPQHGAVVFDAAGEISSSPFNDAATGQSGYYVDGVHYSLQGALVLGDALSEMLRQNFRLPRRAVLADFNDARWITANPGMTGDTGGVATSWTVSQVGSATVTKSKTSDGYQRLVVTGGAVGVTSDYITMTQNVIKTDRSTDGKTFRAYLLCRIAEGNTFYGVLPKGVIAGTGVTTTSAFGNQYATSAAISVMTKYNETSGIVLYQTPKLTVPAGTGSDSRSSNFSLSIYGSGTIDIIAAGLLEEE